MKIIDLECWQVDLKLQTPYTIAYETVDKAQNVFLKLITNGPEIGVGCAAPDLAVTRETAADVIKNFNSVVEPALLNQDPFRYEWLLSYLKSKLPNSPSLLAMVDMALFDLMAKQAGQPVYRLLGGYRDSIATSMTIGILPLAETLEMADEYVKKGFKILKVKGGADWQLDAERMNRIREKTGPSITLRFDANQGYSVAEALSFIREASPAKLELLEQPTEKENTDLLRQITNKTSLPVMADESLMTLKDVFHLTANECTDMINIKLMKTGGINEAMRINSVARAAGVGAMVGCMDESALGIAAGLHFALAKPNIHYADLDGHFDLADDPFADLVICKEGVLYPKPGTGFGWDW